MLNIGLVEGLPVIVVLLSAIGILDAAVKPESVWRAADQSKITWILVQVLVPFLGLVAYLFVVRPKLRASVRD